MQCEDALQALIKSRMSAITDGQAYILKMDCTENAARFIGEKLEKEIKALGYERLCILIVHSNGQVKVDINKEGDEECQKD